METDEERQSAERERQRAEVQAVIGRDGQILKEVNLAYSLEGLKLQ